MKITHSSLALHEVEVDVLLVPIYQKDLETTFESLSAVFGEALNALKMDFKAEKAQTAAFYPQNTPTKRLFFIGLGEAKDTEHLRRQISLSKGVIERTKAETIGLTLPQSHLSEQETAQACVEGILLATYQYKAYKTDAKPTLFNRIVLVNAKKGGLTGAERGPFSQ
jgi:leucyl aminopeptidase